MSQYPFGQDTEREAKRLAAVEQAFDPCTRGALIEVGVGAGWRCWEVGAGRGSIARWLAGQVGSRGHVLATDLDNRWFDAHGAPVTFLRHDVSIDQLPDGDFDLVHARFLLEHLADPPAVVARFAGALRAGGVLVAEDSAGLEFSVTPPIPVFTRLISVWERAGLAAGWRATYGARLVSDLQAAGLVKLGWREHRQRAPGGEAWDHVRYGLQRLRAELIDEGLAEDDLDAVLDSLADPTKLFTGPPVEIAWGRRPN